MCLNGCCMRRMLFMLALIVARAPPCSCARRRRVASASTRRSLQGSEPHAVGIKTLRLIQHGQVDVLAFDAAKGSAPLVDRVLDGGIVVSGAAGAACAASPVRGKPSLRTPGAAGKLLHSRHCGARCAAVRNGPSVGHRLSWLQQRSRRDDLADREPGLEGLRRGGHSSRRSTDHGSSAIRAAVDAQAARYRLRGESPAEHAWRRSSRRSGAHRAGRVLHGRLRRADCCGRSARSRRRRGQAGAGRFDAPYARGGASRDALASRACARSWRSRRPAAARSRLGEPRACARSPRRCCSSPATTTRRWIIRPERGRFSTRRAARTAICSPSRRADTRSASVRRLIPCASGFGIRTGSRIRYGARNASTPSTRISSPPSWIVYVKGDESRAAYLDVPAAESSSGVWPASLPPPAATTPTVRAIRGVTVWKGFQRNHAAGLELLQAGARSTP